MYGRSDPAISYDMLICGTAEKYTGGKYQYGQEEDGDSKWVLVDMSIGLTSRDNVKEIRERHQDDVYFLIAVSDRIGERIDLPDRTKTVHTLFQFHQKGEAGPQTPIKM